MQNYAKVHLKSPQNEHEKLWSTVSQRQKTHAVASPVKMHQNAFIFVVPDFALLKPWMQKRSKSQKIDHKIITKMRRPVLQWSETHAVERTAKMHQNAFISVVPGVALPTPWMQKSFKIVEIDHKMITKIRRPVLQ